ncbi:Yip1 family protein [Sphingomonas sp.]|uniref:Yip1 family protein n=1 Tax=Sphingomonas sp. TaxID=28214 RepID=UPI001B1E7AC0|nr:Yip1 family protein [Sphingomonas sp.]MBO9713566.1 YIP1 family protein [Sphingomonas sp.]
MASEPPVAAANGMIGRIIAILTKPKHEFEAIAAEPMTVQGMLIGWAAPLAAIGPIANMLRQLVFGYSNLGIRVEIPMSSILPFAVASAAIGWVMGLVMVVALALVISELAPNFGGQKDMTAATKLAVFSFIPAWLTGIFGLVPGLGVLGVLGLYSFYLLYVGLPILMRAPQDKAIAYVVVAVLCAVVLTVVASWFVNATSAIFEPQVVPGMRVRF